MKKIDYKKDDKDLYLPKTIPSIINVPRMTYIMVDGMGNPNIEDGEYSKSIELLYGLSYTIKMSYKGDYKIPGYIEYTIYPLEGLWWLENDVFDLDILLNDKSKYRWTSMIRQPSFVTEEVFNWAKAKLKEKKPHIDIDKAKLVSYEEGLCVQIMHLGPYDEEKKTIDIMENYIKENNYQNDISSLTKDSFIRRHHEIYLSDPRKTNPDKLKTVIRHPIKK